MIILIVYKYITINCSNNYRRGNTFIKTEYITAYYNKTNYLVIWYGGDKYTHNLRKIK